jgi:hypothetical protein
MAVLMAPPHGCADGAAVWFASPPPASIWRRGLVRIAAAGVRDLIIWQTRVSFVR